MKKNIGIICLTFLGFIASPNVWGNDEGKSVKVSASKEKGKVGASKGIMTEQFIRDIESKKAQEARDAARAATPGDMEIEVRSVNILKYSKDIGEIFIPNDDVADISMLSSRSLYLSGKAPGTTYLKILDKQGNVMADLTVRVTYPKKDIKSAIAKIYPELNVELLAVDNNMIVKGNVDSPEMAQDVIDIVGRFVESAKIINKLSIATATQVMLKVKIAEVTRDVTKSLGINWRALDISGTSSALIGMSAVGGGFPEFASDLSKAQETLLKSDGVLGSVQGGRWIVGAGINNLAALIEALAYEKFGSILAEPNLIALSGNEATFSAGGEKGYMITQPNSNNQTTEFKKWGTSVKFTPVVISEDRINIKVSAEVSSVEGEAKDKAPDLTTKNVETVVELGSGQSLAIAGLLQTKKTVSSKETPLLADIPILGALFKQSQVDSNERELVIIVTPYIIKPSSKALKCPTDMVPKILSPLQINVRGKYTETSKEADSSGFSLK